MALTVDAETATATMSPYSARPHDWRPNGRLQAPSQCPHPTSSPSASALAMRSQATGAGGHRLMSVMAPSRSPAPSHSAQSLALLVKQVQLPSVAVIAQVHLVQRLEAAVKERVSAYAGQAPDAPVEGSRVCELLGPVQLHRTPLRVSVVGTADAGGLRRPVVAVPLQPQQAVLARHARIDERVAVDDIAHVGLAHAVHLVEADTEPLLDAARRR